MVNEWRLMITGCGAITCNFVSTKTEIIMPFLRSQDGTNLYYNDWGTGKPIILVHGRSINSALKGHRCLYLSAGRKAAGS